MLTLRSLRREISDYLSEYIGNEANSVSRYLLSDMLSISLTQLLLADNDKIDIHFANEVRAKANRIANGEPLQYVTGISYFCDLAFAVDKNVLIPRPETEQLVQLIVNKHNNYCCSILDIGTGSGCIAISLKKYLSQCDVTAIDISDEALEIAKKNAEKNSVNVNFEQYDILKGNSDLGQYDIIVSNPPYITLSEQSNMKANVLDYEPHIALFVPDGEPLLFYETIVKRAVDGLLKKGGSLYFEINERFGNEVAKMLENYNFSEITIHNDIYDKQRVVECKLI